MARQRKSTAELKLHGGYRKDRHANRPELPAAESIPCPPELEGDAQKIWDSTIAPLVAIGALRPFHIELCISACRAGAVLRQMESRAAAMATLDYRTQMQLTTASTTFRDYLRRLGATPADSLKLTAPPKPKNELPSVIGFARRR